MLADPTLSDLGTLARFLVVAPDTTAGNRLWHEPPAFIAPALKCYGDALLELLRREPPKGTEPNELAPRSLPLSSAGRRGWIDFHDAVEQQLGPNAPWAGIRSLGSKLPARLAGVMALVANPDAGEITVEAMESGIELARCYASEALRLFEAGQSDPDLVLAEKLLAWLHAGPDKDATHLAEIYQRGPNAIRDKRPRVHAGAREHTGIPGRSGPPWNPGGRHVYMPTQSVCAG